MLLTIKKVKSGWRFYYQKYPDDKIISSLYVVNFKNGYAVICRVYTNNAYRNKGLAKKLLKFAVDMFGKNYNLKLSASPNRYNENDNIEALRKKLYLLYSDFGFELKPNTKTIMIRRKDKTEALETFIKESGV